MDGPVLPGGIRTETGGCTGLNYGPYSTSAVGQYPQLISNVTAPANVEFTYEACLPTMASSGDDKIVFIPRYINCSNYYMVRGDQWHLSDTCGPSDTSMLFYDSMTGSTCTQTTFTDGNTIPGRNTSIPCIQRNQWYSYRVRICSGLLQAKTWPSGATEPGWQLSYTDSALNEAGNYGFEANQGDITFRNLNVSNLTAETGVVVTDNLPSCFSFNSSTLGSVTGNVFTWSVGNLAVCNTPMTCTIVESIPSTCSGLFTNTAAVTSDQGAGNRGLFPSPPVVSPRQNIVALITP